MRRLLALGLLMGCGGAPGRVIGWSDNLNGIEPGHTIGEVYEFSCPGGGQTGATVWGTDVYTDDSAICPAAVHAGKVSTYNGGSAGVEVLGGQQGYTGSTRNGVTSLDFGAYPGSMRFR
jgi:hypothetical protein